jgi:hypothetical protein
MCKAVQGLRFFPAIRLFANTLQAECKRPVSMETRPRLRVLVSRLHPVRFGFNAQSKRGSS